MNKANVFLLVVVSSLLTYISMATQPAATAGVAQEKWEYAVSTYTSDSEFSTFEFLRITPGVPRYTDKASVLEHKPEEGDLVLIANNFEPINRKTFHKGPGTPFHEECRTIFEGLGDLGWHPYQVIPYLEGITATGGSFRDTVYWRRRVQ